jgi:hypothetical protein
LRTMESRVGWKHQPGRRSRQALGHGKLWATAAIGLYRGMSRIRFDHLSRQSALGGVVTPFACCPVWVALFFYTVNQVLVRLWARVIDIRSGIVVLLRSNGNIGARKAAPQRSAARVQRRVKILSDGSFPACASNAAKRPFEKILLCAENTNISRIVLGPASIGSEDGFCAW